MNSKKRNTNKNLAVEESEPENLASSSDDEEGYEVERIIAKRLNRGKTQYLLKWKNYPDTENTWEPEENIMDADMIVEFENEREKLNQSEKAAKKELGKKRQGRPAKKNVLSKKRRLTNDSQSNIDAEVIHPTNKNDDQTIEKSPVRHPKRSSTPLNDEKSADDDHSASDIFETTVDSQKKPRGRPRKTALVDDDDENSTASDVSETNTDSKKKSRGRPEKKSLVNGDDISDVGDSRNQTRDEQQKESPDADDSGSDRGSTGFVLHSSDDDEDEDWQGKNGAKKSKRVKKVKKSKAALSKKSNLEEKSTDSENGDENFESEDDDVEKKPKLSDVEKILDSRNGPKGKEYLLKWKNYSPKHNSWEPASNLKCTKLMENYEAMRDKLIVVEDPAFINGTAVPVRITGTGRLNGRMMFMAQIEGKQTVSWISNAVARKICPQVLLDFYEERLLWSTD